MSELTALASKLNLPERIAKVEAGRGGLPRIVIAAPGADAQVYLHGAHVTHFQPRGGQPVLFMSGQSRFDPGKAIRGGVPVIFPWFGPRAGDPSAPAHGFARTVPWDLLDARLDSEAVIVRLALHPSDATRKWLAHDFELVYSIRVGQSLETSLEVRNATSSPFTFEEALHTYLSVGDVGHVSIAGLSGRTYLDKTANARKTLQEGPIRIERETDRVYLDTPDTVSVSDPTLHRRLTVAKRGSNTTVIWNPWIEKARSMSDFGDDEWPRMLCVETANAAENAVTLPAGASHTMAATITIAPDA